MGCLGTFLAECLVGVGTLALAAFAAFQEPIRRCWSNRDRPIFEVSIKTEPPDCSAVSRTRQDGQLVADCIYIRLWVKNAGKTTANDVEVYARGLRKQRADGGWDPINTFPPMNLVWSHVSYSRPLVGPWIHFKIAPKMGRHCDIGSIVDPARRKDVGEDAPGLGLTDQQTSLTFGIMVAPNNRAHIVGPGEYQLDILIAAENVSAISRTLAISLKGTWYASPLDPRYADEKKMLSDGVGVSVLP